MKRKQRRYLTTTVWYNTNTFHCDFLCQWCNLSMGHYDFISHKFREKCWTRQTKVSLLVVASWQDLTGWVGPSATAPASCMTEPVRRACKHGNTHPTTPLSNSISVFLVTFYRELSQLKPPAIGIQVSLYTGTRHVFMEREYKVLSKRSCKRDHCEWSSTTWQQLIKHKTWMFSRSD